MTVSKTQMMHYFFDLEEKGHGSKERFTAMWQGIARQAPTPKDLSIILHRTAKYLAARPDAWDQLRPVILNNISAWTSRALMHMGQNTTEPFSAWQLSNIAWAFARLDMPLGQKFWRPWRATALAALEAYEMNAQDLNNSAWALAKLGMRPDAAFFNAWQGACEVLMHHDLMNVQHRCNSLWAVATFGMAPGDVFMDAWRASTYRALRTGSMGSRDINNCLWSLSVVDNLAFHPDNYNLAHDLMAASRYDASSRHQTQIAQATHYFGFPSFPARPWKESSSSTEYERDLASMFRPVAAIDMNFIIASQGHRLDMCATLPGSAPVLIELDGTQHFTKSMRGGGDERFNGSTLLMTALIRDALPDHSLLRVPYTVQGALEQMPVTPAPVEPLAVSMPAPPLPIPGKAARVIQMVLALLNLRPAMAPQSEPDAAPDLSASGRLKAILLDLQNLPSDAYVLSVSENDDLSLEPILPRVDYRQASARAYNIMG